MKTRSSGSHLYDQRNTKYILTDILGLALIIELNSLMTAVTIKQKRGVILTDATSILFVFYILLKHNVSNLLLLLFRKHNNAQTWIKCPKLA